MVIFVRTVATIAAICLLAQGSSAAALPNSDIQARSPFSESSIISKLLTRADGSSPFSVPLDEVPSPCQSLCPVVGCSDSNDTNCICTNEISQRVANCLSCAASNAPDSLSKEKAQEVMDAVVAECNDAGKPINGHIINITAGASVTTNGNFADSGNGEDSVTTNGPGASVTTNGGSVTTNEASATTNGASDPTNGASNGASGRGISFGMGIMGMIATVVVGNLF
ncbi:hypothetical protein VKT23_009583 [Stygiomarasmius scandens]|uniref:Extracellular membrane protein CFEM domain-containing protein n=1 Tax=Marasmiellus scandens TaxID=2682957 RepID=A0ABR1J3M9_9AGAR